MIGFWTIRTSCKRRTRCPRDGHGDLGGVYGQRAVRSFMRMVNGAIVCMIARPRSKSCRARVSVHGIKGIGGCGRVPFSGPYEVSERCAVRTSLLVPRDAGSYGFRPSFSLLILLWERRGWSIHVQPYRKEKLMAPFFAFETTTPGAPSYSAIKVASFSSAKCLIPLDVGLMNGAGPIFMFEDAAHRAAWETGLTCQGRSLLILCIRTSNQHRSSFKPRDLHLLARLDGPSAHRDKAFRTARSVRGGRGLRVAAGRQ